MVNRYERVSNITPSLLEQDLMDIFSELITLKKHTNSLDEFIRKSTIIRLVTILEQFCRKIIQTQIQEDKTINNNKGDITLKKIDLKYIDNMSKAFLISISHNFQNVSAIKDIKNYGIDITLTEKQEYDLNKLFTIRHDLVHTVKGNSENIGYYYDFICKLLKKILELSKYGNGAYEYLCGRSFAQLNNIKESQKYFKLSYKIMPITKIEYIFQGLSYMYNKKNIKALNCFNNALKIDNTYSNAWNNKGILLMNTHKYSKAISCFDNATKFETTKKYRSHICEYKAKCYYMLEKYEESTWWIDEAIYLKNNLSYAYYVKGAILSKLNRSKEAIVCYETSINIKFEFIQQYVGLIKEYCIIHDYTNAKIWYNKAKKIEKNSVMFNGLKKLFEKNNK